MQRIDSSRKVLPFLKPGALIDGARGERFQRKEYEISWPRASAGDISPRNAVANLKCAAR
jgi:hypothetical protein